jgi:hypothetical protein
MEHDTGNLVTDDFIIIIFISAVKFYSVWSMCGILTRYVEGFEILEATAAP